MKAHTCKGNSSMRQQRDWLSQLNFFEIPWKKGGPASLGQIADSTVDRSYDRNSKREKCQNVITKLNYQFMDFTDKGLILIYIKKFSGLIVSALPDIITVKKRRVFDSHENNLSFGITQRLFTHHSTPRTQRLSLIRTRD